jgi:hypothetical protein
MDVERGREASCCNPADACVFAKALRAHSACCELARRESIGEGDRLTCSSAVARVNCDTLAALLRERAAFALRLPREPAPLLHGKALQLHCGAWKGFGRRSARQRPTSTAWSGRRSSAGAR